MHATPRSTGLRPAASSLLPAVSVLLLTAGVGLAAPAGAATKIALEGEASPGGNGLFVSFAQPHLTNAGHVVFFAETDATVPPAATGPGCLFRYAVDGTGGVALLCLGGSVGLTGADFWLDIDETRMDANQPGDLVFYGKYRESGGADYEGVFHLSSAGVLTDLGITVFDYADVRINDSAQMVVTNSDALFMTTPSGPPVELLHVDDLLPDDPASFVNDTLADIGPAGEIAVSVISESVCCGSGPYDFVVYSYESGTFTRLAEENLPIGPFSGASNAHPRFTPGGRLLLLLEGEPFQSIGIAEWDGAAWSDTYSAAGLFFNRFWLVTAGLSRFAYSNLTGDGKFFWGIVGTGIATAPLAIDDPLHGGSVTAIQPAGGLSTTHWAAVATLSLAGTPDGLFVGRTENRVPSLGLTAGLTLAILVGAAGTRRLRR